MIESGWIKLHRSLLKWEWSDDPNMVALFFHLLLNANYEEKSWHGVKIGKGQLIIGRKKLAEMTGISEQTIRTCLERLKSTQSITISARSKYSLITITNWEKYQDINQMSNQQLTSNQPATNQQLTTPKEVKNIRSKESSKKKDIKKKVSKLPEDWIPSPDDKQLAIDRNWTELEISDDVLNFIEHFTNGKGRNEAREDWSKSWKAWVRKNLNKNGMGFGSSQPIGISDDLMTKLQQQQDDLDQKRTRAK